MLLVLDGFYAAASASLLTFFIKAALNLSNPIGIVPYFPDGPSFKYSRSSVLLEVLVKFGDLGLVTCI
jgi:hypothetical protein